MTTQDLLEVKDIKNDVVILKDGSVACILQTSAVNFDLLSENEQLAMISTFAAMLNSLSFSIQIVIRSKRLDISSYIGLLQKAEQKQQNPLLKEMMTRYRAFVENIIRENEVLDKQFYIIVSVSYLEVSLISDIEKNFQKALTILMPRRDHIMRQVNRIGLRIDHLDTEKLVRLYYDLYNESDADAAHRPQVASAAATTAPVATPIPAVPQPVVSSPAVSAPVFVPPPPNPILIASVTATSQPHTTTQATAFPKTVSSQRRGVSNSPFVVEELPDDFSSA